MGLDLAPDEEEPVELETLGTWPPVPVGGVVVLLPMVMKLAAVGVEPGGREDEELCMT